MFKIFVMEIFNTIESFLIVYALVASMYFLFKKAKSKFKTTEARESAPIEEVVKSDFSIEFYPLTKRYYPKYKENYLQRQYATGIVEQLEPFLFAYASYGKSEKEAEEFINLFKEQQFKENVIIIHK